LDILESGTEVLQDSLPTSTFCFFGTVFELFNLNTLKIGAKWLEAREKDAIF
jgi:hypothetical protein